MKLALTLQDINEVYLACGADPNCKLEDSWNPKLQLNTELNISDTYVSSTYEFVRKGIPEFNK